jgi:hypothetical protein
VLPQDLQRLPLRIVVNAREMNDRCLSGPRRQINLFDEILSLANVNDRPWVREPALRKR